MNKKNKKNKNKNKNKNKKNKKNKNKTQAGNRMHARTQTFIQGQTCESSGRSSNRAKGEFNGKKKQQQRRTKPSKGEEGKQCGEEALRLWVKERLNKKASGCHRHLFNNAATIAFAWCQAQERERERKKERECDKPLLGWLLACLLAWLLMVVAV